MTAPECTRKLDSSRSNGFYISILSILTYHALLVQIIVQRVCMKIIVVSTLCSSTSILTILHSERPKLYGVLAVLSAIGLWCIGAPPSFIHHFTQKYNLWDHKGSTLKELVSRRIFFFRRNWPLLRKKATRPVRVQDSSPDSAFPIT